MTGLNDADLRQVKYSARVMAPATLHALLRQFTSSPRDQMMVVVVFQLAVARALEHVHLEGLRELKNGVGPQLEQVASDIAAEMIAAYASLKAGGK